MQRAIVIRGHIADRQRVDLDEPVDELRGQVEVTLRAVPNDKEMPRKKIAEVLASLSHGTRTQEEIDAELADERSSWGDR